MERPTVNTEIGAQEIESPWVPSREEALEMRRDAYVKQSDHLYMEWQFDQTPEAEQAWREEVTKIKLKIPLPN